MPHHTTPVLHSIAVFGAFIQPCCASCVSVSVHLAGVVCVCCCSWLPPSGARVAHTLCAAAAQWLPAVVFVYCCCCSHA